MDEGATGREVTGVVRGKRRRHLKRRGKRPGAHPEIASRLLGLAPLTLIPSYRALKRARVARFSRLRMPFLRRRRGTHPPTHPRK